MSEYLDTAIKAAQAAGDIIARDYSLEKTINYKEAKAIVTQTDIDAETAILDTLKAAFPDHAFYSEESGDSGQSDSAFIWVIDPLDGTTNFTRQLGQVCTSIALLKNNQPLVGVVYNPLTNQLFAAAADTGATLNNQPISPSDTSDLSKGVIGLGRGLKEDRDGITELITRLNPHIRTPRILGSHALQTCYVASGQLDAFIATDTNYYDIAAAAIIAQEAGTEITDFATNEWKIDPHGTYDFLASAPHLSVDILQHLS